MFRHFPACVLILVTILAAGSSFAGVTDLENVPDWTTDGNQTYAFLGASVATAGDVNADGYSDVLVAAAFYDNGQADEGKVWLFLGSANGLSATPAWTAEGDQADARFGSSVSTAGDVNGDGYDDVVIGAMAFDNGQVDEGRAFLYLGSAEGLSPTPDWTGESNQASANYGCSVSAAGDVNGDGYDDVLIGAYRYDDVQTDEGKAYLYRGNSNGLGYGAVWTGQPNISGAEFGYSVSGAGDVNGDGYDDVIVGAFAAGKVYVYLGDSYALGSLPAWQEDGDSGLGNYGQSVSGAGDVDGDGYADVVVSAPMYTNGEGNEGKVYVYHGSADGPSATPDWSMEGGQIGATFGWFVSLAGDTNGDGFSDVVIGAKGYDNGQTDEGRAFLFHGSNYGLEASSVWTDESDQAGADFGACVACAGDVDGDGLSDVLVGAPYYDGGQFREGRAYLYRGTTGDAAGVGWYDESGQTDARLGSSVAFVGDVNADGYGDLVIGAPAWDQTYINEGIAELHRGGPAGVYNYVSWSDTGGQQGAMYGTSVAAAGDVNGDGYDDVIVGSPNFTDAHTQEGKAFLYTGYASGLHAAAAWTHAGGQTGAGFGECVASAGDVNGDGYGDVIVGADYYDNGQTNVGAAFVFLGSADGLASTPIWSAAATQANTLFGHSVACAGDVNGDGFSDVLVGAAGYTSGQADEGRAFLYLGSPDGPATVPAWTAESDQVSAFFGWSVAGAGDVNGDGYSDIAVGAPNYDLTEEDEGRVAVYLGGPSGPSATPAWVKYGSQAGARFGGAVAAAGDVNGDGRGDLLIGAGTYDDSGVDDGRAYLYLGTATGPKSYADWIWHGSVAGAYYGYAVAGAGDVNGDGFADLLIGASMYTNDQGAEGAAFFHFGNGGDGLDRIPDQWREDDTHRIGLLGGIESSSFRLHARGRTPAGRGNVRLVCEVKPLGTPFDGVGLQAGTWTDTGTPVVNSGSRVALDELIADLAEDTPYCWRMRLESDSPYFPRSRWLSLSGNNRTETDLRRVVPPISESPEAAGTPPLPSIAVTPNPAAGPCVVSLDLPRAGSVRLSVVDLQGRCIVTLLDRTLQAGRHEVGWDGRGALGRPVPAGVYLVRCETGGEARTVKVIRRGR